MRKGIKHFLSSSSSLKLGLSLTLVPVYFYFVDCYQERFTSWLITLQDENSWGVTGILISIIGLTLVFGYLDDNKSEKSILGKLFFVLVVLSSVFMFWLLDVSFAYFGVIFFVLVIYLLLGLLYDLVILVKTYVEELETNLQLMLVIPVLTVLLNYFFGK